MEKSLRFLPVNRWRNRKKLCCQRKFSFRKFICEYSTAATQSCRENGKFRNCASFKKRAFMFAERSFSVLITTVIWFESNSKSEKRLWASSHVGTNNAGKKHSINSEAFEVPRDVISLFCSEKFCDCFQPL